MVLNFGRSLGKIDKQIEEMLTKGSGYVLERILKITIEAYTLRRGTGGSFQLTPKKLANTKTTINPDNKGLIDPETNALSEKCLQAKKLKPYLEKVKLDGIPMPTPICSRIFNKIEEMNPDISITLTDIIKSENGDKYGQKNYFLWIKNPSRLIYGDTEHKEKKHLCDGCFQSFSSEKSLDHHIEWCPGIHENAPQRVAMPVKGVNDFEEFKNYGRMINAPCVIIANFEADNKKCNEAYGGSMIDQELVHINEVLAVKHEQKVTEEDKKKFAEAVSCWICKVTAEYNGIQTTIEKATKAIASKKAKANKVWDHCHITGYTEEQLALGYRKRIYCYDYIDSQDRFLETELPPIYEFTTTLKGRSCKKTTTMPKNLADVWTEFRKMSMEYYELDPSHYVSAPSLSWDGMLKMTGVRIELFTDMAMHDFTKKAKRGGISKAYKPDSDQSTNSMSQYLPIRNYKWGASRGYLLENPAMQKKLLDMALRIKPDAKRGCYLNINSHFPLKTHDYLSDLPSAVENIAVEKDWLCPYNAKLVEQLDGGHFSVTEKLVPHLGPRKNYVIHYQELQYYVKLVYGKTMENVHKYQDVKIMKNNNERDEKAFLKKVRKPSFKYAKQLKNTFIGAHIGKASVTLNKPIIVGASVLGLSKLHMYEFWYGYVKEKYGDKSQLGYMDTDSFIYHVETEDVYKDMDERPDLFNLNGDQTVGKFKDETPGNVITESYHIRAKSYHYVLADKSMKSKHKGVSKKGMNEMATVTYMPSLEGSLLNDLIDKSSLTEQEAMRTEADPMTLVYRDCLFEKKALCPIDTNNWFLSDGITPLPYSHWRNMIYKNMVKDSIPHEEAEKRAMRAKLPEKYQNEYSEKEKICTIVNIKESIIALECDVTKIYQNLKTIAREIYYLYNAMAPEDFEKMLRSDIDEIYNSISHIHLGKEIQSSDN
ncbi:hypothetical protein C1645_819763 [Glomus cerebriforme]|uniref:DNA-directed DNA polymerase n=1 Tax=Glomus cerebriforme TaxID=658196 RepID=A0A397T9R7_9GLOM|nr:hypothetical protein C1645_819763 [Glomus cerebriforme]